ncbi:MAG TPA: PEP-CTERM sorting domain-containing protein [Candidatus Acidoferrales bacterium]|jgi:hypothetical protein|nr:PEP-CTERM sorting domain-containing protein [Candidatus Acidoferrales bacterium]
MTTSVSGRIALRLSFALAVVLLPVSAFATPMTSTLNITGSLSLTSTGVDFLPAGGGTGVVLADAFSNTGTFAVLNSGNPGADDTGTIYDLSSLSPTPGSAFISGFSALPGVELDLDSLNPGVFGASGCFATPAVGETCSVPGTPFNFINVPAGTGLDTLLSFSFAGTAVEDGVTSDFTGTLSAQFAGSYQVLLANVADGTSSPTTFSATITVDDGGGAGGSGGTGGTSGVPEPGTLGMLLLGLGTLGVAGLLRRSRKSPVHA